MSSAGFSKKDSAAVRTTPLQTILRRNNSPRRRCGLKLFANPLAISRTVSRPGHPQRAASHRFQRLSDWRMCCISGVTQEDSKDAEINFGNSDGLGSFCNYGNGTGGAAIAD